jgi:hypothetical protein
MPDQIKTMYESYFDKVNTAVHGYMNELRENPSREVTLLYSLKPFMPERQQESIDKAADMLMLFDAMRRLSSENSGPALSASVTANAEDNNIIHGDGVYEMDRQCLSGHRHIAGMMPGLLMMAAMSK